MRNIGTRDLADYISPPRILADSIFAIPFLKEETCDYIISELEAIDSWTMDETDDYAAPEVDAWEHLPTLVFNMSQHLNNNKSVLANRLTTLFMGKYSPIKIEKLFFIKYTPETQASLGLHFDRPSNITFTIPLNDNYEGGDLEIPQLGRTIDYREDVEVGNMLIFPGGSPLHLHRATAVTQGIKYLMVIWTKAE